MLKKLVKYGNSNALVLDKALLELLNIAEGSVVKIKTDGTSLIITPQNVQPKEEAISHTIVPHEVMREANAKVLIESSKEPEKMQFYIDELHKIENKYTDYLIKKYEETDYMNKLGALAEKYSDTWSPEFLKESKALLLECAPEYAQMEKEYKDATEKYAPSESKADEKSKEYWSEYAGEFKKVHEQYKHLHESICKLQENPEFINESVLLAEKYNMNKKSAEYLEEYNQLINKYVPEWAKYQEELKTIAQVLQEKYHEKN